MTTPAQRARFRAEGRCMNCGRALPYVGHYCETCRKPRRARYQRLRDQGRCVRCLQTAEERYAYCAACRALAKAAREAG